MPDFSFPNIIKTAKLSFSDGRIGLEGRRGIDLGLAATIAVSLLYLLIFCAINIYRYNTLQYHDWDFSLYANAMWNLTAGKAFIPVLNKPLLGNHFTVIAYLIAPVYFLFRSPATLLCLKVLAVSLVPLPVYMLARRKFDWHEAFGFVLVYLFYPSLLYITLYEFHFEDLSIIFLALSFYFLIVGKKPWFFITGILAMLCKENVPLVVAALGLYGALFRPRRRLMGLAMFVISAAYFLLVTLFLQPLFTPGGGDSQYAAHYAQIGEGFSNIYIYILTHPVAVIKDLFSTPLKIKFFRDMLSPLLYLPLLRPDILLITAPTILKNLLSKVPTTHTIYWHYTVTIIPFFVFSLIFGFKKLARLPLVKKSLFYVLVAIVLLEALQNYQLYKGSHYFVRFHAGETIEDRVKLEALELIPPEAPVIATFDFLPKLSQRKGLFTFYMLWRGWLKYFPPADYALIDFNDYFIEKDINFMPVKIPAILAHYTKSGDWGVLLARGDNVLLKKGLRSDKRIITLLGPGEYRPPSKGFLTLDGSLELVDLKAGGSEEDNTIHLVFHWRLKGRNPSLYKIFFFASDGEEDRMFREHSVGYRYFTPGLEKNQVLREDYWLLLPDNMKGRRYTFSMGFVNLTRRGLAKMEATDRVKIDGLGKAVIGAYDNR